MKSHKIAQIFVKFASLITEFINDNCDQRTFCQAVEPWIVALKNNGSLGVLGILKTYPTMKERFWALIHEVLHDSVNRITGVPSGGIGAIVEKDRRLIWGFTVIDPQRARITPNLREKLARAQKLHLLIERSGI